MSLVKAKVVAKYNDSELRREVTRLSSMANKRIDRLQRNNLETTPAFQSWENDRGGVKFGVKGKSQDEVKKEYFRVKKFLDDETSTVKGAYNVLKEIARNTGIKYTHVRDLAQMSKTFFDLSNKVNEYLDNANDVAYKLGYQKIWELVNTYVQNEKIDISDSEIDVDELVSDIVTSSVLEDIFDKLENRLPNKIASQWERLN